MPDVMIDDNRLEELVDKAVRRHLETEFEDMEQVRRSPGAAIVRLEARVESIEKTMATKGDIANLRAELIKRIGKLEASNKLIIAMLLSVFGAVIATLVKLFFLS